MLFCNVTSLRHFIIGQYSACLTHCSLHENDLGTAHIKVSRYFCITYVSNLVALYTVSQSHESIRLLKLVYYGLLMRI
jgi:hypothetical protein